MATRSLTNSIAFAGAFPVASQLPNCAGGPQLASLEAGDHAYVTTEQAPYYCVDPTPGAAVWVPVATGSSGGGVTPPIYIPPAVTNSNFGGKADALLAPSALGSGGTYPTGFTGGESFLLLIDGVVWPIVFTVNDQTLAQVCARINTITGKSYATIDPTYLELRITADTAGSVMNIAYGQPAAGSALTTLGFVARAWYGVQNPAATDNWAAFQKAIDACAGSTLEIPGGAYRIALPPGADCALYIQAGLKIVGAGNIANGVAQLLFDNPTHSGDFICIEGSAARGTMLESIIIRSFHNAQDGRHAIVVHAPYVTLERVAVSGFGDANSYAIVQESGTVGSPAIVGACRLEPGIYFGSNFLRVYQADIEYVGDPVTGTGGGYFTHGSDSFGILYDIYNLACGTSIEDSSLIGAMINQAYGEVNYTPIYSDAAGGSKLFECMTEDFHAPVWISSVGVSVMGSTQASFYHFGAISKLFRSRRSESGVLYEAEMVVPGYDQVITWWRNNETYSTGIGRVADTHGGDVFAFAVQPTMPINLKGRGWGIGVSDPVNTRGPCLPIVGRAWLNGPAMWKCRQASVTVAPGLNTFQLFPNYASASLLGAGDQYLAGADTHCFVTVELHETAPDVTQPFVGGGAAADAQAATRVAALAAAAMRVGGTVCLWQDSVKGNWAVQITNETGSDIVVDLIWNFAQWQTSGAASGP